MEKNLNKYDYEKVHLIALNYKKGDTEKAEELISMFSPFLDKYMLFFNNSFTLNDYSIRNYVGLYNSNIKKYVNQFRTKPVIKAIAYETIEKIHYLLSDYEVDELYNECVCSLLEMADKYKDTKPSFHVYVKKCFHFYLKNNLDKFTKNYSFDNDIDLYDIESMNVINEYNEEYEESLSNIDKSISYNMHSINILEYYSMYSDEHISSINWELGITCCDEFKKLTNFERRIIVESFLYKKKDIEISNEYGLGREAINRKKKIAISRIEYQRRK